MTTGLHWVRRLIVGVVVGGLLAVLDVPEPAAIAVIVVVAILFGLADHQNRHTTAESPEESRQRRQAIASCAREALEAIEPPLAEEHYQTAFRRICHAIADGRKRVRIVAGERRIEVTLEKS